MDSPSDQQAAPEAHNVGMEAHRAVGVEESGRDGEGNRVGVGVGVGVLAMAISIASRAGDASGADP